MVHRYTFTYYISTGSTGIRDTFNLRPTSLLGELNRTFAPYSTSRFSPATVSEARHGRSRRGGHASRSRERTINKRLIVIRSGILPMRRQAQNIILDGHLIFSSCDDDIRNFIIDLINGEIGSNIKVEDLILLRCSGKILSKPALPTTFTWSADTINKFVGQGAVYVQVYWYHLIGFDRYFINVLFLTTFMFLDCQDTSILSLDESLAALIKPASATSYWQLDKVPNQGFELAPDR